MPSVSDADLSVISHLLEPGEEVRWIGQPSPGRQALGAAPISVFGAFFGGFALFWMAAASGFTYSLSGGGGLFSLFGLPFLLVGLGMLLAPLFAWRSARRTLYVVTDRRALIATPGPGGMTLQALRASELDDVTVTVGAQGRGTLRFGPALLSTGSVTTKKGPAFEQVPDVMAVKKLVDALRTPRLTPALALPGDDTADLDAGDEASDPRMPEPPAWNLSGRPGA